MPKRLIMRMKMFFMICFLTELPGHGLEQLRGRVSTGLGRGSNVQGVKTFINRQAIAAAGLVEDH